MALAELVGYSIFVQTELTAFTSATATFSLVLITMWYAYETRRSRIQAISPSFGLRIVPHSPEFIKSQIFLINYGTGAAHNLQANLQLKSGDDEEVVAEAPILDPGHEVKFGQFINFGQVSSDKELKNDFGEVILDVSYIDQLGEKHHFEACYDVDEIIQGADPINDLSERVTS